MKNLVLFSIFILSFTVLIQSCAVEPESAKTNDDLQLHVPSPEWQDQVIYFLMTDRFADGDPSNNDQGAGVYDPQKASHFSGGDIQGVIDHLDYIKNLGATAVWTTPVVANQWWSQAGQYGGYHGYWATDFSAVDKHFGDLKTYQNLSDQLHRRDMYLIQDIVVNHTGNFFNYKDGINGYDPENTAKNFVLLENKNSAQPAPVQSPFDLIDRLNPKHVEADIYNWTPSITDYADLEQQFTYQLATLADLNTKNPIVVEKMKQIYSDWIKTVGVDAFRIDTVRYVEHEFFHQFMHDDNGIVQAAKETGRDHFLAFGEVFDISKPYQNDAEHRVASYYGTEDKPELNSLISFPLHHDLKTVFGQSYPTGHLAYRIQQHMDIYNDPYTVPTFIDNHDMSRFLANGNKEGLKQALAAIFTLPGIPTIYQGTEQGMTETRQAMFAGGFLSDRDYYDQQSELYRFIAQLAKLRTSDKLFTRGTVKLLASNKNGPGVLAYLRQYQGRTVVVLFNTANADILASGIQVADSSAELTPVFEGKDFGNIDFGGKNALKTDSTGNLNLVLPKRSIAIFEVTPKATQTVTQSQFIKVISPFDTISADTPTEVVIKGESSLPNTELTIIKNALLTSQRSIKTNESGDWQLSYTVNNLGTEHVQLQLFDPKSNTVSNLVEFTTKVVNPEKTWSQLKYPKSDLVPNENLVAPQHNQSVGQQQINNATAEIGGDVLTLTFEMATITNDWIPANGFDNVAFSIFFDFADQRGLTSLPVINASMPKSWEWNIGHVVYGWGNTVFDTQGATAKHQGQKLGIAPRVDVDQDSRTIRFTYKASDYGLSSWLGTNIYATTWDITGEGAYRELQATPSQWKFGNGQPDGAKIMDAVALSLTDSSN